MAGKKKGGKGKGKGKKGKGEGKKPPPPRGLPQLDEGTKIFYLVQIRNLEERVWRYQKRCDELEVANNQFHEKFEQMATDKKEIVAFWKKQVEQKTDEIADLNDRHIGLQQTRDNEREAFKKQIQEQRTEYQEMKDQLTSENMILGGKLAALEEFKVQKEELMAKFSMMEEELARKETEHKDSLYMLEKKAVMEKDRLKKEMILRVNQVAAEFRKVSNKQMAETTKRTIRENVSINAQLAKMSDKTIELIQENDELKEKEKKMRQQIEMLETNEKEMAKKNNSNMKVIYIISEKCRKQQSAISEFNLRDQEYQSLEADVDDLREELTSAREELEQLTKEKAHLQEKNRHLDEVYNKESKTKMKVEQILNEAAGAISDALTSKCPDEESLDEQEKINNLHKRDHMLENLLVLLNSSAALGIGPHPKDLGKQWDEPKLAPGNLPGVRKGILKGELPLSPASKGGTLPHYNLGDLGLIPRPSQHIATNIDKMKNITQTAKLGALRGVLQKSVATQTVSAPKALFYAEQLSGKLPASTPASMLKEIKHLPSGSSPPPVPKKLVTGVN